MEPSGVLTMYHGFYSLKHHAHTDECRNQFYDGPNPFGRRSWCVYEKANGDYAIVTEIANLEKFPDSTESYTKQWDDAVCHGEILDKCLVNRCSDSFALGRLDQKKLCAAYAVVGFMIGTKCSD